MSEVFRESFPNSTYRSSVAKKRLLRLPVAAIRVGDPSCGQSQVLLMEALSDRSAEIYQKIIEFYISGQNAKPNEPPLAKKDLEGILLLVLQQLPENTMAFKISKQTSKRYYPLLKK